MPGSRYSFIPIRMKKKTSSAKETARIAEDLARRIKSAPLGKRAKVLALKGDLGSGKTTFAQAFARGLGVRSRVASPTFVLMRRSVIIPRARYRNFFHIDAYRLKRPGELLRLGLREEFLNPENIILIEWADRVRRILPKGTIWIEFTHGAHPQERAIKI